MPRAIRIGLASVVLAAWALPTAFALAVGAVAVAVMVMATVWSRALHRRLDVALVVQRRWVLGETGTLVLTVANRSRLPAPRVRVEVRLGVDGLQPATHIVEVAVPGRHERRVEIALEAVARGRWRPPPTVVWAGDPFGLVVVERHVLLDDDLVVLPPVRPISRHAIPAAAPVPERPDPGSLLHDPASIVGVRPYRPGDPLRGIHWPASAASGTLMRRELEPAQSRDLLVVLDLAQETWRGRGSRAFESAVTVAASLLADAVRQQQTASLCSSVPAQGRAGHAQAAHFPVATGRQHLDALLVHLAGVRRHPGRSIQTLLATHVRRAEPGTTVVVVTGAPLPHDAEVQARALRTRGLVVVVWEVVDPAIARPRSSIARADPAIARRALPMDQTGTNQVAAQGSAARGSAARGSAARGSAARGTGAWETAPTRRAVPVRRIVTDRPPTELVL